MDFDRRKLLAGMVGTGVSSLLPVAPNISSETSGSSTRWHPLTQSLLDRAARPPTGLDVHRITRLVHELSGAQGLAGRLVIKWLKTPSDAFDHLSRRGLTALLELGETSFWRPVRKPLRVTDDLVEHMCELRALAADILRVDEYDRLLMRPKLAARGKVAAAEASLEAIFQARAVAAQVGWLETSLPAQAAGAIWRVELLLSSGFAEFSEEICHQLVVFEAYERALLATWETPDELFCVPRSS